MKKGVSEQRFGKFTGAFQAIDTVLGRPSRVNDRVKNAINVARRENSKFRKPTKKAAVFPFQCLVTAYLTFIKPFAMLPERIMRLNIKYCRALFRGICIYTTFCRFCDFKNLKDSDFRDGGSFIEITFPRSKNDQFHRGSSCVIPCGENVQLCPASYIRWYFDTFGLVFQNPNGFFVNFRYEKSPNGRRLLKSKNLCKSNSTRDMRDMLTKMGLPGRNYTEKSFKNAGVTAATEAGLQLEEIGRAASISYDAV